MICVTCYSEYNKSAYNQTNECDECLDNRYNYQEVLIDDLYYIQKDVQDSYKDSLEEF